LCVVRDDRRGTVEHRALEARVRTHVLADLLAEIPRVAVRGKTVEQRPEGFPGADRERRDAMQQLLHGSEVADEREPGPQAETDPEHLLERLARELAQAPRRRVELHALAAAAFRHPLHPQVHLGPYRLRARVAAPQTPGERGKEEEAERGDDEETGEKNEILRP